MKSLNDFSTVITGNPTSQAPLIVLPLAITVTQENKSLMSSTKEHTQIRLSYATVLPLVYGGCVCVCVWLCVCVCVCACMCVCVFLLLFIFIFNLVTQLIDPTSPAKEFSTHPH